MSASTPMRPPPFKKRFLIPFWLAQLALMLFFTIIYCFIESAANNFSIRYLIYIFICLTGILLEIIEILLFSFQKLKPITYLILQAAQMFIWLAMFVKEVVLSISQEDSYYAEYPHTISSPAILFVVVNFALLFLFVGSLIYASIIFRRHCRCKKSNNFVRPRPLTRHQIQISTPNHLTTTLFPSNTPPPSLPKNTTKTTVPNLHTQEHVNNVTGETIMVELPLRPPLPPYFERLSSIGRGAEEGGMMGAGVEVGEREVFGLAKMRGGRGRGRRGAIALG